MILMIVLKSSPRVRASIWISSGRIHSLNRYVRLFLNNLSCIQSLKILILLRLRVVVVIVV